MALLDSIAHAARPQRTAGLIGLLGWVLLIGILWMPPGRDTPIAPGPTARLTIDVPDVPAAVSNQFDRPGFADSRPWPTGMVIGLGQKIDDPMILGTPGVIDSLLSALKAALLSIQT